MLYAVRERGRLWSSGPSEWVILASVIDIAIVTLLAASGTLMAALPVPFLAALLIAAAFFALVLDQIKLFVVSLESSGP